MYYVLCKIIVLIIQGTLFSKKIIIFFSLKLFQEAKNKEFLPQQKFKHARTLLVKGILINISINFLLVFSSYVLQDYFGPYMDKRSIFLFIFS